MPPTLLLFNGIVRTLDHNTGVVSALAIQDEEILAVGSDSQILALSDYKTEKVDLGGKLVLPGFIDAHCHFDQFSRTRLMIDAGMGTKDAVLDQVARTARSVASGKWITGHGWNQIDWNMEFPTAAEMDMVAPTNPVYLTAKSLHMGWANSAALHAASIRSSTRDPEGGRIGRDKSGNPDGMLFENAQKLIWDVVPRMTTEDLASSMKSASSAAWQVGLTGLHDFDGRDAFVALQLLRESGELGLRVVKNIPVELLDESIGLGVRSGYGDDWLRIGNIKVFMDGALGPRTAHMMSPYEDEPQNIGLALTGREELLEWAKQASAEGLAMTVHAIGDRANHDVLEVYRVLREYEKSLDIPMQERRHRIEHLQLLHRGDLGKLANLGVIASMQPIHATSDMTMAERYWGSRCEMAYSWHTHMKTGATLAFGSDAPVESINPLWGIHAAVTRQRPDGSPSEDGWYPEERLTVEQAVRAYTVGAAYAGNMEERLGTLTCGKLADFIVLDRDIYDCAPVEIRSARVLATIVGGEWKHRDSDFD